jgi:flagellar motor component MotA
MDIVQLIETLGIPVAFACILGYCCYYLIGFINGRLMQKLDEQAKRQEDILVTLINVQKEFTQRIIENNTETNTYLKSQLDIFKTLTGNGLKKKEN